MAIGIRFAPTRPRDIKDAFVLLAAVQPYLDDLDAIEVALVRILDRFDQKAWLGPQTRLPPAIGARQVATHRYAGLIRGVDPVRIT